MSMRPNIWRYVIDGSVGLCTVYRIDGITVAVYGGCHRTVEVPSRFEPYTARAQLTPYFTIFYGRLWPSIRLPLIINFTLLSSSITIWLRRTVLRDALFECDWKWVLRSAMRIISARTWCVSAFVFIACPLRSIHDLENMLENRKSECRSRYRGRLTQETIAWYWRNTKWISTNRWGFASIGLGIYTHPIVAMLSTIG